MKIEIDFPKMGNFIEKMSPQERGEYIENAIRTMWSVESNARDD